MRSILLVTFSLVLASCGARSVQHNVGGSADSGTKPSDTVVILGGSSDGVTDSVTCLAEDSDTGSQEDNFPYGDFVTNTKSNEIKLMAYNLENLFDTEHDVVNGQDKNDYFYLPANHPLKDKCGSDKRCKEFDWNDSKLTLKIDRLAKVIESQGDLPDVIGFEEIENAKVLGKLADRLGYSKQNLVITQGPDERGIEVAVLYKTDKLTFVESKEHGVDPGNDRPTRDVLEVVFDINSKPGERLAVYVNHWPSQGTPMSGWKRSSAAMTLVKAVRERQKAAKFLTHAVALGDFNTLQTDRPHPFLEVLLNQSLDGHLQNDVQWHYEQNTACKGKKGKSKTNLPQGTYFYRTNAEWNKFDRFFPSSSLVDGNGVEILINSFRVVTSPHSTDQVSLNYEFASPGKILIPNRFNENGKTDSEIGASDHFPIVVKLVVK